MKKITTEVLKQKTLTESDIKLLCRRANNKDTEAETMTAINRAIVDPIHITDEQTEKGLKWLNNLRTTPIGNDRKNSPFGYNEDDVLDTFQYLVFDGLMDIGGFNHAFYVPIYTVFGSESNFTYYVAGGKIHLI